MDNFKEYLKEKRELINRELRKYLPHKSVFSSIINDAIEYSLFAGGKRIRPILCLEACKLVGGNEDEAIPCACAIEMIHTYSLIHDDLPSMDNDDFRRGKPTCHKKFGEAIALLAGDALLTLAFHTLTKVNSSNIVQIISEISDLAGVDGLIGGQVADLEKGKDIENLDKEKLLSYIHLNKTAKLIIASIRAGGLIGGAHKSDLMNLTLFAENLGIAFQISDDILDLEGTMEELGKSPGKDLEQEKITFPSVYGLEKSKEILKEKINNSINLIKPYGKKALFLYQLAKFIEERKN